MCFHFLLFLVLLYILVKNNLSTLLFNKFFRIATFAYLTYSQSSAKSRHKSLFCWKNRYYKNNGKKYVFTITHSTSRIKLNLYNKKELFLETLQFNTLLVNASVTNYVVSLIMFTMVQFLSITATINKKETIHQSLN